MEGSGDGGVTAALSDGICSSSPKVYPFTAWDVKLLNPDSTDYCTREGNEAAANRLLFQTLTTQLNWWLSNQMMDFFLS